MALSSGLGFYNHAVLIQALAQTGNFSVTSASSAVSLFFIVSGLTGLVVAPILERVDARWIICTGAMISALGLALLSSVSTLLELYVVYFLFGVGFCASGLLPATTLIARWFVVYRARIWAKSGRSQKQKPWYIRVPVTLTVHRRVRAARPASGVT